MQLSLIIPTYNSEGSIRNSLQRATSFLSLHFHEFEIIVVDDGSTDNTSEIIDLTRIPNVKKIRMERNIGKGRSVVEGMKLARGDVQIFIDSDLPYDLKAILVAYDLIIRREFHLVVGDRSLPGSNYYDGLGGARYFATKLFKFFVRILVTGEQFDTQCGFKAFRKDISKAIFPMLTVDRFAFDVELLYIALKYNLEIRRIPVRYRSNGGETSVRLLRDGISMFLQILCIPLKARKGTYDNSDLHKLHLMNYWDDQSGESV